MGKVSRQVFTDNGTFVVPAGVTRVRTISRPTNANSMAVIPRDSSGVPDAAAFFIDNTQMLNGLGLNNEGELGNNSVALESSPTFVVGSNKWVKFIKPILGQFQSQSGAPVFAIDSQGLLYAWGYNASGQLGIGSSTSMSSPVLVSAPNGSKFKQVMQISFNGVGGGTDCILALDGDGNPWAWGNPATTNVNGTGVDTTSNNVPTAIAGTHKFVKMFLQNLSNAICASAWGIDTAGALWGWGSNFSGGLGINVSPAASGGLAVSSPTLVVGATSYATVFPQMVPLTSSKMANFFLDTSQNLWSVGNNDSGQLGVGVSPGVSASISSPAIVVGGQKFVSMVQMFNTGLSTSKYNTRLALDAFGNAWSWGLNDAGQLGANLSPGTTAAVSSPVQVVGGHKFASVYSTCDFAGTSNSQSFFGIDTGGALYSWGDNATGQLGLSDLLARSSPVLVTFPAGFGRIQYLKYSLGTILALDDLGRIYAWGYNSHGQTGVGTAATAGPQLSSPVQVVGGRTFMSIVTETGALSVFAAGTDGNLYSWGGNPTGVLGTNDLTPRSSPTLIVGNKNIALTPPLYFNEVSVIPGSSIPITMRGATVAFGTVQVGYLGDSLTIEYDQ